MWSTANQKKTLSKAIYNAAHRKYYRDVNELTKVFNV